MPPSPKPDRSRAIVARRPATDPKPEVATAADDSSRPRPYRDGIAAAVLAAVTFAVFAPALGCKFINFDDPEYVLQNEHVRDGLSAEGVRWAFTTFAQANWHPLTWLSLQLDATLWGPTPFGFHLTNVVLHAGNAALLFLALRALTGTFWRGAAVALLFAVHPLRVESVAWVAERKDDLSVLFGLGSLWAYAGYVRSHSTRRAAAAAILFALSLASKPTLVTLPCLMLVLDWWPAGRVKAVRDWRGLVVEKLPLFALAVASSCVTYLAQAEGGAMKPGSLTTSLRVGNAAVAYGAYLAKTAWPTRLAVFYPHPGLAGGGGLDAGAVAISLVVLGAITAAALRLRARAPYLLAGWLWYLGTLVPMLGLVQVGGQAYADRYSYFPQIGLLIAACWAAADLALGRPRLAAAAGVAAAAALAAVTWGQLAYWRNSVTLWEHALDVTTATPLALYNCGEALQSEGRTDEAAARFQSALEIDPKDADALFHLGMILQQKGRLEEATRHYEKVCDLNPRSRAAHSRLGDIYSHKKRYDESARHYRAALELGPTAPIYCNLALVERALGRLDSAAESYRAALALNPGLGEAHNGLGSTLVDQGRINEGMAELREAIRYEPASGQAHNNLGHALEVKERFDAAAREYERAAALSPRIGTIWFNLGRARARQHEDANAADCFARALVLEPEAPPFRAAFVAALDGMVKSGRAKEAAEIARQTRQYAADAGRAELARQLDAIRQRYERGETVSPAGAAP
jgi:tetratricopeptide (TPR) repeat protein